ncbi:MAG: potassium transporter TrkA [Microcystis aeruginosa L211-07]|nr:potassium transporter TrkA [Microcystis aeruginosa L211-07]
MNQESLSFVHGNVKLADRFLVCGLGSLGQHCVKSLKEFGVSVVGIELIQPPSWEINDFPDLLEEIIIGDCRQKNILARAGIDRCRAALIVTSDERINATTALIIRQLNPHTRLVVRSSKDNLNQLLKERLGNFIAYEPTQLPANAFALATLGTETLGFLHLDGQKLRIIQRQISPEDGLLDRFLGDLNTPTRRLLAHTAPDEPLRAGFYQWSPSTTIRAGDTITTIETTYQNIDAVRQKPSNSRQKLRHFWQKLLKEIQQFWQLSFQQQIHRVAFLSVFIIILLVMIGTFLFHLYAPRASFISALSGTAILLLGGYGDVFGASNPEDLNAVPWWMQLFSLFLTLAGTAFIGVLYAILTETLLSSRFQFIPNRPPVPQQNHIVIVGLGRVGKEVANLLLEMQQAIVGVSLNRDFDATILPKMPLMTGNIEESLKNVNLDRAKSIAIVTDDEILNLEVALTTRKLNPQSYLVIRTTDDNLSQQLSQILPRSHILGTNTVAAEAFTGAAFGENIIYLFRWAQKTILVTEYEIEAGDTLNGSSIGDIAYGYRVVPILHQRERQAPKLMPEDYLNLRIGDRIVVLATINGLRRVEQGRRTPKTWRVRVEKAFNRNIAAEAPTVISRFSNCPLKTASDLMENLPATLGAPLYEQQAIRLVSELKKIQVQALAIPINPKSG